MQCGRRRHGAGVVREAIAAMPMVHYVKRQKGADTKPVEADMRKLATLAAAALIVTGSAGTADAQYWRGYGGYYRHGYGWGGGGAVAAGLIGGALLGGLITAAATAPAYGYGYPAYSYGYGYPAYAYGYPAYGPWPGYYAPRPVYYGPRYYPRRVYYGPRYYGAYRGYYGPRYVGPRAAYRRYW